MPTGYTYPVIEGEITTATEFAQLCARAFMWNMRDTGMDAPLRMPEPNNYYTSHKVMNRLEELEEWDNSTEEEKYSQWSDYIEATEKRAQDRRDEVAKNREAILPIYNEINRMDVPSTHQAFKDFMLEQLDMTIRQDATFDDKWYATQSYPEWVDEHRGYILRSIEVATEGMVKEEEKAKKSREWINGLIKHFGVEVLDF